MAEGIAPRLEMRGIRKRFGATLALDGVDLEVSPGAVLALVGENGAGKSTLMKILSGAEIPDDGSMRLDGVPYRPTDPLDARMRGVAMIYQELSIAPHLSVEENILLGIEPARLGVIRRSETRRRVSLALAELGHPEIDPRTKAGTLSIGLQQIVEIARALVIDAKVLVFDEPTSSLSKEDVQRLFSLIRTLKAKGLAIVYISHFLEEVLAIADRYTVLRDGKSVGEGTPGSAAASPETAPESASESKNATTHRIINLMVGRELKELFPRSERAPGEILLEIQDLHGDSVNGRAESASLKLHRGEVVGIAGLIGAGRTELLRAIFGMEAIRSGQIRLGIYHGPASPSARWNQGMGMVSEDRKGEGLATSLSISENLTLPKLRKLGPWGCVWPGRQRESSREWIRKLSVKCRSPGQKIGELSGGNQQKVAIARLLAADVDVLLLDEPTRGVDVGSKAEIYRWIDDLASRHGKAILLVSSYLPEILGVSDRIAVMCRGKLGPVRRTGAVDEHALMSEAISGAASGTAGGKAS